MASVTSILDVTGDGDLNEALKDCDSDRSRFQTISWLINHIKYMDAPSNSGWKRTAERLRGMTDDGLGKLAARVYGPGYNRTAIRGWQELTVAAIALCAGLEFDVERALERLIDNAHADKNKVSIAKWEGYKKIYDDGVALKAVQSFLSKLDSAIAGKGSATAALRALDAMPYAPGSETKEEKREREAKQALLEEDDDDF